MTLAVITEAEGFRRACDEARRGGQKVGLVPTMGALHDGHLALVRAARRHADQVAVTIFVNPTQFGPNEDFQKYPRNLDQDRRACEQAGATLVFAPSVQEMYPLGEQTRVSVSALTTGLCGASRPGHFDGVATIVTKLLVLAGPCVAVFGRKDYQQFKVIERLVLDLMLPVSLIGHPTLRESDGLAMSSRNAYLSPEERQAAVALPQALARAACRYERGERGVSLLRSEIEARLTQAGFRIDYVALTHADSLVPLLDGAEVEARTLVAVAAFMGSTRLIDNCVLGEDASSSIVPGECN